MWCYLKKKSLVLFTVVVIAPALVGTNCSPPKQTVRHFHTDHLGSVQAVTNLAGGLVQQTRYEPYGEGRGRFDGSGAELAANDTYRHEFTGHETDVESGLIYAGARYYDPETAQFLTHDPARQYASPYQYGPGDPMNGTDPDGRIFGIDDAIVAAVLIVGGAIHQGVKAYQARGSLGQAFNAAAISVGVSLAGGAAFSALPPLAGASVGEVLGSKAGQIAALSVRGGMVGYSAYGTVQTARSGEIAGAAIGGLGTALSAYGLAQDVQAVQAGGSARGFPGIKEPSLAPYRNPDDVAATDRFVDAVAGSDEALAEWVSLGTQDRLAFRNAFDSPGSFFASQRSATSLAALRAPAGVRLGTLKDWAVSRLGLHVGNLRTSTVGKGGFHLSVEPTPGGWQPAIHFDAHDPQLDLMGHIRNDLFKISEQLGFKTLRSRGYRTEAFWRLTYFKHFSIGGVLWRIMKNKTLLPSWRATSATVALIALGVASGPTSCTPQQSAFRQGVYVDRTVIAVGETTILRVSTAVPSAEYFIRDEISGAEVHRELIDTSEQHTGFLPHLSADWKRGHQLPLLPPGLYRVGVDPSILDPDQREVKFILSQPTYETALVVRPAIPQGDILVIYDRDSQNAYNEWGGHSFYTTTPSNPTVGEDRPGLWERIFEVSALTAEMLNSIGATWDAADNRWIEEHPTDLAHYRAIVAPAKLEYATRAFRDAIEAYVDGGGRLLALSTEMMLYQARREGDLLTCYKRLSRGKDPILLDGDPTNDHLAAYEWARVEPPATTLFGTSTWLGGQLGTAAGWRVARSNHWVFAGTGLQDGDTIIDMPKTQILDGTDVMWQDGLPFVTNTAETQAPPDTLVLATVPTGPTEELHLAGAMPWSCWLTGVPKSQCTRPGTGTIAIRQTASGGVVGIVPQSNWLPMVPYVPVLETITMNLLTTFAAPDPIDVYDGYSPIPATE